MEYILLNKLDVLTKDKLIKSYKDNNYEIIYENNNIIILRLGNKIIDEDTYINITISIIKKRNINNSIIDITKAFMYAKEKGKYNMFNNKFDWYIRNILIKEMIDNGKN